MEVMIKDKFRTADCMHVLVMFQNSNPENLEAAVGRVLQCWCNL